MTTTKRKGTNMKDFTQGKAIKLTLTVKRPNGKVEQIVHPSLTFITEAQFKQIQRDTKAAGRGEVLSYEIERETVDNRFYKEQQRKARQFDNINNDGAEGYNPYR